jgi:predicted dinucleotide-binding enzyme
MSAVHYRLQIPQSLWARAWAELSLGRRTLAWGRAFRSSCGQSVDLLVYGMKYVTQLPDAREYSLIHDFFLFDAPHAHAPDELPQLFRSLQLRDGQLLVYVQPGLDGDQGSWLGAVLHNGQLQPLRAIHLVGPGMLQFRRPPAPAAASGPQWSRLTGVLGEDVFQRFRRREILLVGCGRLGSLLAAALVRMGLRKLTVVDPDRLEPHNRDATVGNSPRDCGQPKATVLLKHLHRIRPAARLRGLTLPLQHPRVVDAVRRCDALFLCVDNDDARLHATQLASQLLKVTIDCGTLIRRSDPAELPPNGSGPTELVTATQTQPIVLSADIRLILPGGCLNCIGGLQRGADAGAATTATAPEWSSGGRLGSLPSINHIAVGTAIQLWLDLLSERLQSSWWQRLRWDPGTALQSRGTPVQGDPQCAVCSGRGA